MRKSTNTDLHSLATSGIRRFTALANQTPGCIKLTLGEPEFATPAPISEAVATSLKAGKTHYPPNNGYENLRAALSSYMASQGLTYSADEIIVTAGATEALAATIQALVNPGDEVVVPTPAFGLYETLVVASHAKVTPLPTAQSGFQITPEMLMHVVGEKTKAFVLTSPNNPTGCVYSQASLDALAASALKWGYYIICDDVYNRLAYQAFDRFAVLHPELREQIVVVDSFSKPWAMTGWRLGWLATSSSLKAQIEKMHQYLISSVPAFLQDAAIVALRISPEDMRSIYAKRRAFVVQRLADMGLSCNEPAGAFYAFPSIEQYGIGSEEFCTRVITEAGVALVPGTCFGAEGYVRLSYCCSDKDLSDGLDRLEHFLKSL